MTSFRPKNENYLLQNSIIILLSMKYEAYGHITDHISDFGTKLIGAGCQNKIKLSHKDYKRYKNPIIFQLFNYIRITIRLLVESS